MTIIICPHCEQVIFIQQMNCGIFRCGIYKTTHQPIPAHLSKSECENLKEKDLIYGCGKPFQVILNKAVICDYI